MMNMLQSLGSVGIFLLALAGFAGVLTLVLSRRIRDVRPFDAYTDALKQQHNQVKEKSLDEKQSAIKNFLDKAEKEYKLIFDIVREWLETQRSLSNFQKYDFELHTDYYTRSLRIDHAEIARNLLLTGLLFTFIGLGLAFSTMEAGTIATEDLTERLTQSIIPSISLAFSTTIAALLASLVVLLIGRFHNQKIDNFEEAISKFLIIDVHPYFEQGGKENDIRQVVGLMEGVSRNINEVNINLQNVGQQASNTLQELARGVGQFSELSAGHRGILERTESLLQKVYENNLESEKSIANLNSVIKGVTEIFNAEELVLKDLVESSRNQQSHIEGLSDNTAKLIETSKQRTEELRAAQKESEEALKLSQKQGLETIQESIEQQVGGQVTRISEELSRLADSMEQNNKQIKQRYAELTQELETSSQDNIAQIERVTEKIGDFAEQVEITQRNEQQERTSLVQKYRDLLADMAAETTSAWRDMSTLAQQQAGSAEQMNNMLKQRYDKLYAQQEEFANNMQQNHEAYREMVEKLLEKFTAQLDETYGNEQRRRSEVMQEYKSLLADISNETSSVWKGVSDLAEKQAAHLTEVNQAMKGEIAELKRRIGPQQKTSIWNIFKRKG